MNKILQSANSNVRRVYHKLVELASHNPRALFLASVMILSVLVYTVDVLVTEARYKLSDTSLSLIGTVNKNLAKKVVLDKNLAAYRFNADNITPEMTGETDPSKIAALLMSQKQQTGGGGEETKNLYSLDLPIDPTEGTRIYDANSKTSFKLIPEFAMDNGRSEEGRVVYPLQEGGQAIYSVKGNGIKEDIVLAKPRGDSLSFSYRLELPKTLQARLDDRGNLGVYGVNPAVSSAIASQNTTDDPERLKDIQVNGTKNHLIYLIPAPTIIQSGNQPQSHQAKAMYRLNGDQLTVETSGLEALTYPISIDPSVVVTSTADFATGNDEGNISFDTDAISRAKTGEPTIGAWAGTTNMTVALYDHATVTYNGYMYIIGGRDAAGAVANVRYAQINSNGTLGAWTATTSLVEARYGHAAVVYNGYLYVLGGTDSDTGGVATTVRYAPINTNGTIGVWVSTASMQDGSTQHSAVAYNGYLYVVGGYYYNGSINSYDKVRYAPINGDGTVGAWNYTTVLGTARHSHASVMYGGYMYVIGGINNGSTYLSDIQYAPINTDGTIGSWSATTTLTSVSSEHDSFIYKGYLYKVGGRSGASSYLATVEYALINANGTLGAWTAINPLASARYAHKAVVYGGVVYSVGGNLSGAGPTNSVQYSAINTTPPSVMNMSSWSATTNLGLAGGGSATKKAVTRLEHTSEAYNGYLYVIGGRLNATNPLLSVHSAPINADGTVGAWSENTPLLAARYGHTSTIVNGYLYVVGGQDGSNAYVGTTYYAPIGVGGTIGTWATTSALGTARAHHGMTNYNGYMYVASGYVSNGVYTSAVEYAVINANGTLGAWTATTVGNADDDAALVAYNSRLYLIGSTTYYAVINANGTIGSWSPINEFPGMPLRTQAQTLLVTGHVIVFGGRDSGALNSTAYAKINADGSVPGPTSGTSFTTGRTSHAVAMYNDRAYVTGGTDAVNSYLGDVQYASVVYGPPESTVGTTAVWQSATATNLAVYGQATVTYNNFVYIVGGYGGAAYRNDVRYAPLNANGTIGSWTTSLNTMSMARFNGAAVAYKGYLYVTGGQQGSGVFTNTTEYAAINADGTLGSWTTSGSVFTTPRYGHTTVAYNDKIYVIAGGDSANVALADVKYATINANGTIGTWADAATTTAARDIDGFVYGGRLYVLGGLNGSTYSNTVRYAQINGDGTLGSWTTSGNVFTNARSRHATVAVNGYMYISGGGTASPFGDLQYAPINNDGSVGVWKSSNSLSAVSGAPAGYYYHSMAAHKGKLFSLAGIEGTGTAQSASYTTVLNAPALSSVYSKMINLGQLSTLNSITTNGLLPPGQNTITFRTAGTNGVFGAWQSPSVLSGSPIANVRYVMYRVTFDDSLGTGYSTTTAQSSVTDVTVDYTVVQSGPSPDVRLRHNKYFNGEVLQSLETQ